MSGKGEGAVVERIYTVPLGRIWTWRRNRASRAIRLLRDFIIRHMKAEEVIIGDDVNSEIYRQGMQNPPRRLRVKAEKDSEGRVTVSLAERGAQGNE